MSTLQQLVAQREALDTEIARLRQAHHEEGIARIKALMLEYGLTIADFGNPYRMQLVQSTPTRSRAPVAGRRSTPPAKKEKAKYRDPATGDTWSGRGLMPRWLRAKVDAGQPKEDFAV